MTHFEALWHDLRLAARTLGHAPAVAATAVLTLAVAAAGLVLVGVGVFSVMAYTVSLRTREIGIRMAGGRDATAHRRHGPRQGAPTGCRRLRAGGLLAYVFSRFFVAWMAGAPSMDVTTVGLVCGLLVAVGLAASMVPGIQAARVDPLVALCAE